MEHNYYNYIETYLKNSFESMDCYRGKDFKTFLNDHGLECLYEVVANSYIEDIGMPDHFIWDIEFKRWFHNALNA